MVEATPIRPRKGGCENCFYHTPKVGSKGPRDSPFVIVGESPGIEEVVSGLPFFGPSGTVIDEALLRQGGATIPQPFWTNAINCLPSQKSAEKQAAACIRCRPRLLQEIRAHPRKVILALGGNALMTLTNQFDLKITKERGKLFRSDLAEVGIVAAVHPAFLLRGGGNWQQFERDVKYAVDLVREGEQAFKLPDGTVYRIFETPEEVAEFADELKRERPTDYVAADIETEGLTHWRDQLLCLGIQHAPKLATIIPGSLVTDDLFANRKRWVWHNGKFDIRVLRYRGFASSRVDEDNMLLNYALNERRGIHDLDQVASDWLGSTNHKGMIKPYLHGKILQADGTKRKKHYGDIPLDILHKYLAFDLRDTYGLFPILRPMVAADRSLEKLYTRTLIPASELLVKVELNGMTADPQQMHDNETRLMGNLARAERAFNRIAVLRGWTGGELNLRSYQQMQDYLYKHLRLLPKPDSSTNEDTLLTIPRRPSLSRYGKMQPDVRILLRHREAAKQYGTYIKNMWAKISPQGKIHPTLKLAATATGRLAGEDPNPQNIPRDPRIRGQFIPRSGYAILEVDYSQAELRCLALLSRCPDLCAIFDAGKDLHVEVSIELFGAAFTHEDKMAAKAVNFGIVYGRTAASIANDTYLNKVKQISVEEAQGWIDGWAKRFPGAWAYINECRMAPIRNQTMVTVFGNKKRPGVVSRERLFGLQNEAANFPHQNIASNINLHAAIKLFDPLRTEYDTHIINLVHDCIVTETPFHVYQDPQMAQAHVLETAKYMSSIMEAEGPLWGLKRIPFKVEPEFGFRWGNVLKFKDITKMYGGDFSAVPDQIAAH